MYVPAFNVNDLRFISGAPLLSVCIPIYVNIKGTNANVIYRAGSRNMFRNRMLIIALIISHLSGFVVIGSKPTPPATPSVLNRWNSGQEPMKINLSVSLAQKNKVKKNTKKRTLNYENQLSVVQVDARFKEFVEIRRCLISRDSQPSIFRFNILLPILLPLSLSSSFLSRYKNTCKSYR